MLSVGGINTGKWQTSLAPHDGAFFAYAMNNYWDTNFKERQGGDFVFRFALTSHGPNWTNADAFRFGWGHCTDLLARALPAGQAGRLPAGAHGFLQVDAPNVVALTFKRAEDGDGYVVRLMEIEGRVATVRLRLPGLDIDRAVRTNIVERHQEDLPVSAGAVLLDVPAWGIETVRLRLSAGQ